MPEPVPVPEPEPETVPEPERVPVTVPVPVPVPEPEPKTKTRRIRKKIFLEGDEEEPICGISTTSFVGKCEPGVSTYKEFCNYNPKTRKCIKKTNRTWKNIEKMIIKENKRLQLQQQVE